jgi:cytochrome b
LSHWLLLIAVASAWITRHGFGWTHEWIGYVALALVLGRTIWGFAGSGHARFRSFVRPPAETLAYASSVFRGRQKRYLGHNPLGGWMSLTLWLLVALVCASGWLYTTDAYWGIEWVETLHRYLTNLLLAFVALHIAGVILTSVHDGENLVLSMIHGRKRQPAKDESEFS